MQARNELAEKAALAQCQSTTRYESDSPKRKISAQKANFA
jgi:hypothetical protein